jgi:hypothetical protein
MRISEKGGNSRIVPLHLMDRRATVMSTEGTLACPFAGRESVRAGRSTRGGARVGRTPFRWPPGRLVHGYATADIPWDPIGKAKNHGR